MHTTDIPFSFKWSCYDMSLIKAVLNKTQQTTRSMRFLCLCTLAALLAACSSAPTQSPSDKPLKNLAIPHIQPLWKLALGKGGPDFFQPVAVDGAIYAATRDGNITKVEAKQGSVVWQKKLGVTLSAGVGSDGHYTAVGSLDGWVYTLDEKGELLWRANIQGALLSPPLVGYNRVLVRAIDGRIHAFNAQTGTPQWVYQHQAPSLILHASQGMRWAGPNAVIAGFPGGSLAAISAQTGQAYWETPVAWPRGFTEVERINDVVGTPTLVGRETCAVTFQGQLACFDAQNGEPVWEAPLSSSVGLDQNGTHLVVVDDHSIVRSYDAVEGRLHWQNTLFRGQGLSAPLILENQVLVGDRKGRVYVLSLDDGKPVARLQVDHHAIATQPVVVDDIAVVQTQGGQLYGFKKP